MKNYIISLLQKLLGYERYLVLFARIKLGTQLLDRKRRTYRYFERLIPENATVAVVGASIGITTFPFLRNNRRVHAYEPVPTNVHALRQLRKKYPNGTLSIHQVALGNTTGQVEMVFQKINGAGKHGLSFVKGVFDSHEPTGETITVNIGCLDQQSEFASERLDALKVVAENYELEIFLGAQKIIERDRPIIYCELWPNEKRAPVLTFVQSLNYRICIRVHNELVDYFPRANNYRGKHFIFLPNS